MNRDSDISKQIPGSKSLPFPTRRPLSFMDHERLDHLLTTIEKTLKEATCIFWTEPFTLGASGEKWHLLMEAIAGKTAQGDYKLTLFAEPGKHRDVMAFRPSDISGEMAEHIRMQLQGALEFIVSGQPPLPKAQPGWRARIKAALTDNKTRRLPAPSSPQTELVAQGKAGLLDDAVNRDDPRAGINRCQVTVTFPSAQLPVVLENLAAMRAALHPSKAQTAPEQRIKSAEREAGMEQ
jgi:hypothetical protein